jgi:hypothetical protein
VTPEGRVPRQCETCAFRPGSDAAREANNYIKARLCALGGVPFYCHEGTDWKDPASHVVKDYAELRGRGLRVCAGWKEETGRLARAGHFLKGRMFKRAFAIVGLESLILYLSKESDPEDKADALANLKRCFKRLTDSAHALKSKKGV